MNIKNRKGFISTTMLFSFFILFLMLLIYVVGTLVDNRLTGNVVKLDVKKVDFKAREEHTVTYHIENSGSSGDADYVDVFGNASFKVSNLNSTYASSKINVSDKLFSYKVIGDQFNLLGTSYISILNSNYAFDGWTYSDGDGLINKNAGATVLINGDMDIYLNIKKVKYQVYYQYVADSIDKPLSLPAGYKKCTTSTFPIGENMASTLCGFGDGYNIDYASGGSELYFAYWYEINDEGAKQPKYTSDNPTIAKRDDVTLYSQYLYYIKINYEKGDGGFSTGCSDGNKYKSGDTLNLCQPRNIPAGKKFSYWYYLDSDNVKHSVGSTELDLKYKYAPVLTLYPKFSNDPNAVKKKITATFKIENGVNATFEKSCETYEDSCEIALPSVATILSKSLTSSVAPNAYKNRNGTLIKTFVNESGVKWVNGSTKYTPDDDVTLSKNMTFTAYIPLKNTSDASKHRYVSLANYRGQGGLEGLICRSNAKGVTSSNYVGVILGASESTQPKYRLKSPANWVLDSAKAYYWVEVDTVATNSKNIIYNNVGDKVAWNSTVCNGKWVALNLLELRW